LGDGVITLDLNGKVQYMNKIAEELTGWSLRKAKGRNLGEIYPVKNEETGEKENNILDKVLKHGIVKELANHTILISNNGREIPVMDTGAPVFDIDGTVTGIVLTFGDETEKRTQQKLLKESEARLNEAQRIALLGNWELNLNNNRLYWSDEIYRIFEIDKHAFGATYEAFLNSIHPEDRDYVNKAYSDSLRNKLPYAIEHRLLMQDGRIKFVLEQCVTFFDETGNPVRSVGTVQDITERKLAEERYRNTLDNMLEGCHIIGFDWRYLYLNNAADVHNRRPKEELLGRKYTDIWPGTESTEVYGILKHCMDERVPHYTENEFLFPDGTKGWFELSIQPVQEGIFILSQDITGRKKNEEELIMAKEKAEEGDRLKTAFLHNISHEIRTPMNAIVGFSALLNEPNIDSSNRHLYTELIMNGSYQLLSIITDIIDISNIEANTVKVTTSEINLNSIIRSLHEQFLLKANEKNITIVSEPGLPDEDSIIQTDKTKLIQIISNLLNNALKFTWQGQIKFGYGVKDNMIEFYVSDTGLGIPEEYHKKIFERFYQVEDPVEKLNEGIGVGLTICRAYVELLGGEIRLVSTPEVGSTFYFTLPIEKPGDMLLTTTSPMKEISFVFPEKKKILIAEDIESNFKLICHFLSGANADVIRASNGKEAVEKCLSDQSIDLVLMDIRMPVMSGYAATELIRLSKPDIPIIAQTAYGDDRERAIKCGCSGIISKPFDKKHLLQTIQQFI
ncbi:MAG: PAS domain S-box protein, partial [Bacteroidetes bacterium]